jgi:NhaP-type Na+/H+ or K+/H+ antiporter
MRAAPLICPRTPPRVPPAAAQIAALFVRLALGGAAIGLGFCLVTSLWLSYIFQEPELEIVLTFGAAYGCYFVVSGRQGARA